MRAQTNPMDWRCGGSLLAHAFMIALWAVTATATGVSRLI